MAIVTQRSLFERGSHSNLSYAKKMQREADGYTDNMRFSDKELAAQRKREELAELNRDKKKGKDSDSFFITYSKMRDPNASLTHGVVETSKAMSNDKDQHIISEVNGKEDPVQAVSSGSGEEEDEALVSMSGEKKKNSLLSSLLFRLNGGGELNDEQIRQLMDQLEKAGPAGEQLVQWLADLTAPSVQPDAQPAGIGEEELGDMIQTLNTQVQVRIDQYIDQYNKLIAGKDPEDLTARLHHSDLIYVDSLGAQIRSLQQMNQIISQAGNAAAER